MEVSGRLRFMIPTLNYIKKKFQEIDEHGVWVDDRSYPDRLGSQDWRGHRSYYAAQRKGVVFEPNQIRPIIRDIMKEMKRPFIVLTVDGKESARKWTMMVPRRVSTSMLCALLRLQFESVGRRDHHSFQKGGLIERPSVIETYTANEDWWPELQEFIKTHKEVRKQMKLPTLYDQPPKPVENAPFFNSIAALPARVT